MVWNSSWYGRICVLYFDMRRPTQDNGFVDCWRIIDCLSCVIFGRDVVKQWNCQILKQELTHPLIAKWSRIELKSDATGRGLNAR